MSILLTAKETALRLRITEEQLGAFPLALLALIEAGAPAACDQSGLASRVHFPQNHAAHMLIRSPNV
jgi:hypothetical protein